MTPDTTPDTAAELLAETITQAAIEQAAVVNSAGLPAQVKFLIETCGWTNEQVDQTLCALGSTR